MARIAIVGGGIAGLSAARCLAPHHEVEIFEAGPTPGGHARTLPLVEAGRTLPLDSGLIIHNPETYPGFTRLLEELGVETRPTRMSFSVRCARCTLEYGSGDPGALFAQRRNVLSGRHWRLLAGIVRFFRIVRADLAAGDLGEDEALGAYLARRRVPADVVRHCVIPMAAAIWSARPSQVRQLHAGAILGFLARHGMLGGREVPAWRTIVGGSRTYVDRLVARLGAVIHLETGVRTVRRDLEGVRLELAGAPVRHFDRVILATHTDTSLRLLQDASEDERGILGAIRYGKNETVLHTDASRLPAPAARSSWNYRVLDCRDEDGALEASYDLDLLLGIEGTRRHCVTLNPSPPIAPDRILARFADAHPILDVLAVRAQRAIDRIQGARGTFFCGAWRHHGFHEDGFLSGAETAALVLESLRPARPDPPRPVASPLPRAAARPPIAGPLHSALYTGHLVHARHTPVGHRFRYPVRFFVFDLAELPILHERLLLLTHERPGILSLRDRDYGAPDRSRGDLQADLEATLGAHGIERPGGRILLCTQPRVLGYVFNPVSFFQCYDAAGALRCVVAEINNTWGERHRYAMGDAQRVPVREGARFAQEKQFRVSPFIGMDARYEFHFLPERLDESEGAPFEVRVSMRGPGAPEAPFFFARLTGTRRPLNDRVLAWTLLRYPLMTLQIIGAIHLEALRLAFKGVPHAPGHRPAPEPRTTTPAHDPALTAGLATRHPDPHAARGDLGHHR